MNFFFFFGFLAQFFQDSSVGSRIRSELSGFIAGLQEIPSKEEGGGRGLEGLFPILSSCLD